MPLQNVEQKEAGNGLLFANASQKTFNHPFQIFPQGQLHHEDFKIRAETTKAACTGKRRFIGVMEPGSRTNSLSNPICGGISP